MKTRMLAVTIMLSVVAAACGSTRGARERSNPNLITAEELQRVRSTNAYEAVQQLRPQFLTRRGPVSIQDPSAGYPVVRLDGTPFGDLSQLRAIPTDIILSIEFIGSSDATTRWGTGHTGGAILVTTRKQDDAANGRSAAS